MDRILYLLLKPMAFLPLGVLYVLSDFVFVILYYIIRYRRAVVDDNLAKCFPEKTEKARKEIARQFYRNFADYIFETIKLLHVSDAEMSRRMVFENIEAIDRLVEEGRSVAIYFSHCGNWEWAPSVTLHSHPEGVKTAFCQVYRPLKSHAFDNLMLKVRSRFGSVSLPKATVLRGLLGLRRDGFATVTGFMSDQKPSHGDPTLPLMFLGRPTAFITGTEELARKMKFAAVYWDMHKDSRGHYRIVTRVIADDVSATGHGDVTRTYASMLQETILRNPSNLALDSQTMENTGNTTQIADSRPPVAVIILNWNGRALLEEYMPQVLANSDPSVSRIIVADNGSTDDSVEYLQTAFGDSVEIMRFDRNYGFAEGYNKALSFCSDYEYSVLLNSDVAPAKGWDSTLYEFMCENRAYAGCQPKILAYKNKTQFEYAGACGGFLDRDGYPFCRGRIFDYCETDRGQYDSRCEVHWASGACLMVRTSAYLNCGGLDKDFFAHMEEIDLCWRMRLAGYRLACVPAAKVYHLGGGSLPAENPFKTYLNFRNNLLMMYKNLPDADRGWALIRRRLLDTLAWLKFVLTFDMKNAASVVKAHRDFAKMCKKYEEHPSKNLLKGPAAYQRSILVQYFLWRHKTYSALKGLPDDFL